MTGQRVAGIKCSLSFLLIDHCVCWPSCHFDPVDIMQQPVDGDFFIWEFFLTQMEGLRTEGVVYCTDCLV